MTVHLSHPKYRPDIDGLRAIAVLSVVTFHAFPSFVQGGFIGVDVFFVISGFLISTILLENLDKGTFSFTEFYTRRIKRIFPTLIIVLTVTYVLGWFTLLAGEFKQLGKHILGGASFISNFILREESGYFDNVAETKPLLHLWSLGIEEQFYIFYPLTLWVAWKKKFNPLSVTVLIAAISFYLNVNGLKHNTSATFFSPQTRFWELLCGSVLACLMLYKNKFSIKFLLNCEKLFSTQRYSRNFLQKTNNRKTLSNIFGFAGLTVLMYGFFRINKGTHFPGVWALIPVLGAILIISAGQKAWVNRYILSSRIAVWFGLISYPLYLWHWVLLSFPHIILGELPDIQTRIIAVILAIFFSWLTYTTIEVPVRYGGSSKIKTTVLFLLMVVIGTMGYITYLRDGLPFRSGAYLHNSRKGDIGHIEYHKYIAEKYFLCTPKQIANDALKWEGYTRCMQSKFTDKVDIALIGDSHAEHLFIGIAEALPSKNIVFYIKGSVPFLENVDFKKIYESVIKNKSITTVILTMHWTGRFAQVPKGSTLDKELIKVIDVLSEAGKNVYLTDDVPVFPFSPEKCKGIRRFAKKSVCEIPYDSAKSQTKTYLDSLMKVVRNRPAVKLLLIGNYLCDKKTCSMVKENSVLYRDQNHLNIYGSTYVGHRLVEDNIQLFN